MLSPNRTAQLRMQAQERPLYQAIVDSILDVLTWRYLTEQESDEMEVRWRAEHPTFRAAIVGVLRADGLLLKCTTQLTHSGKLLAMQLLTERMLGSTPTTVERIGALAGEAVIPIMAAMEAAEADASAASADEPPIRRILAALESMKGSK